MKKYRSIVVISGLVIIGLVIGYVVLSQPLLQSLLKARDQSFNELEASQHIIQGLSGGGHSSQTLLVFANHAEQRTGGGFVGSVGLLKGENGKLSVDSIRSIYYYDHRIEEMNAFKTAPKYFQNLSTKISARDSLLDGDPAYDAQVFRDLFARESGIRADNVVIITPKVLELMLSYTGGIELPDYKLTVTKDNILSTLQQEVESGSDKASGKDPKTILGVLATKLVAKLPDLTTEQITQLYRDSLQLMSTRQAFIWTSDTALMRRLASWQGSLAPIGSQGAIQITAANHIANKASQAIVQKVDAVLKIGQDGSQRLSVQITRHHTQPASSPYIDPRDGKSYQLIGPDLSWVQLALPTGTRLLSTDSGFEPAGEAPALFGRDIVTQPLETTRVQADFLLPGTSQLGTTLKVDQVMLAQFGWFGQEYSYTVEAPAGYTAVSTADAEILANGHQVRYTGFQISDRKFSYEFTRQ